jgi:hypothetical protein
MKALARKEMSLRSSASRKVLRLGLLAATIGTAACASAQTFTWEQSSSFTGGYWGVPGNWGQDALPTAGSNVLLESTSGFSGNTDILEESGPSDGLPPLTLNNINAEFVNLQTYGSLTAANLYSSLSNYTVLEGELDITNSLPTGQTASSLQGGYGGNTFTVEAGASLSVNEGMFDTYVTLTSNGRPEGTQSTITNEGTVTLTSSSLNPSQIEFGTLTNSGTFTDDYLILGGDYGLTNSGTFTSTGSLLIAGNDNEVNYISSILQNTGTLSSSGSLTIQPYGGLNTSGSGTATISGSVLIEGGIGGGNPPLTSPETVLEATAGGTVTIQNGTSFDNGVITSYTQSDFDSDGEGDTGGLVNADGAGSTLTINAQSVLNDVAQIYHAQEVNATFAATNGGELTIDAQTIRESVVNAGQEHDNFLDVIPSNAVMYAKGGSSVMNLNATTSIELDTTQLPDTQPPPTYNYYEAPAPNPLIYASEGGTVNINTPLLNIEQGIVEAGGQGSEVNFVGNTIDGADFYAGSGGVINVGTLTSPVAEMNYVAGFTASNIDPTGNANVQAAATINIFATAYSGLNVEGNGITDSITAYYGSRVNLTGYTYLGGYVTAEPNSNTISLPPSVVTITESTSAEGLGILAVEDGDINISSPTIQFDNASFNSDGGEIYLAGSNSATLNETSTLGPPGYDDPYAFFAEDGGVVDIQSPTIVVSDLTLYASGQGPLDDEGVHPGSVIEFDPNYTTGSSITFNNVGEYVPNYGSIQASANQGGIVSALASEVSIDSETTLQGGIYEQGPFSPPTSYLLLNYIDRSGLDVSNAGTIASGDTGELVIGGSSFENLNGATLTVGGGSSASPPPGWPSPPAPSP